MKLTAITLNDVRRFTSPVRVTGIGAGLNVMSAPNEEGKSTLFDALQALFFQSYRSRGKEITALRPHAGGAPTVIVDLTTGVSRVESGKNGQGRVQGLFLPGSAPNMPGSTPTPGSASPPKPIPVRPF